MNTFPDALVRRINKLLPSVIFEENCDFASVTLLNETGDAFNLQLLVANSKEVEFLTTPRGSRTCCDMVLEAGRYIQISDNSLLPPEEGCLMMKAEGFHGYLGVPLSSGTEIVGALEAISGQPRIWGGPDISYLTANAFALSSLITELKYLNNLENE